VKSGVSGLLALIALGLGIWLALLPKRAGHSGLVERFSPQHQCHSLVTVVYDAQGDLHYRLAAAAAQHDARGQISYFEQPQLQLFNASQQISWVVHANQARLVQQRQLYLSGNIEIRSLMADTALQKMVTEQVQIDLIDQAIQSDQRVTLSGQQFISRGNGLRGNFNQRVFTLLNSVKTHYAVQPDA
jgi:lipopolysaccharide export system protein LptC